MSDTSNAVPPAAPQPWIIQQSPEQLARAEDAAKLAQIRAAEEVQRAAAPRMNLTSITSFTLVDDENPNGKVIRMGDTFEISSFDYPKFAGKGLPDPMVAPASHGPFAGS